MSTADQLADVERYYTSKLTRFGPTPLGVDWTCVPTQELRFVQLLKVRDLRGPFSVNDLGCGYGALLDFLAHWHSDATVDYLGIDVSQAMVASASRRHHGANAAFVAGSSSPRTADYSVASGIFNVKLGCPTAEWEKLVKDTLQGLSQTSGRGFAVNFLDRAKLSQDLPQELYSTVADVWLDYCDAELGWKAKLLSNYGLREFTIIARPRELTG